MGRSEKTLSILPPKQRLSAARAKAYELMPYFRSGIQSLVPREAAGLGTLGVTEQNILLIDYEVLGSFTAAEAGAVLLHEYMHRYLKHAERFEKLRKLGALTNDDQREWNEACDAEINDDLIAAGCELPGLNGGSPITPKTLGLANGRTAEEYVQALIKKKRESKKPGSKNEPGWGRCGSGAGNPLPNEPPRDDQAGRSEIEQHIQRKADSAAIQKAAQKGVGSGRGSVPAGLARAAEADLEPAKVSWQDLLAHSVRMAAQQIQGSTDYSFTERARMQGALSFSLGEEAPIIPGETAYRAEIAIAVDTSGSMCDNQLKTVVQEAGAIFRHMGGAEVSFVACDSRVHTAERIKTLEELLEGLKGGGGTDFNPVFEALEKMRPRPNVVIFATDGYGPAPEEPPEDMKVVWLIIDGHPPCEWGEHIHITAGELRDS